MRIISHRGYWKTPEEKNTEIAFRRSFDLGFGTETDVRDLAGTLVISHDMPQGHEMTLDTYLSLPGAADLPQALNIKADGLAHKVREACIRHQVKEWFVFDMSVPDTRQHLQVGCPVYSRMSEVEQVPIWIEDAVGIWLDAFNSEWFNTDLIAHFLARGKKICIVSSELHQRDPMNLWKTLQEFSKEKNLLLCTDWPERAKAYFSEMW